jgi:antitoxin FitA
MMAFIEKVIAMANMSIRKLPDETYSALKLRALANGHRSAEAEARDILVNAVRPQLGLGSALSAIGRQLGGVELNISRDTQLISPASFDNE